MPLREQEKKLIKKQNLDIRATKNGRWYDQKVTPDVMLAICLTIKEFCNDDYTKTFTIDDLWTSDSFDQSMRNDFGKPSPRDPGAKNEYDKFISQPLHVLRAAGIVSENSNRRLFQVSANCERLLERVSISEKESAEFLNYYIKETIKASGLKDDFERFFKNENRDTLWHLRDCYVDFICENTPINGITEPRRIFPKVLNIQAYQRGLRGSIRGHLSKAPISLADIRYNRVNAQDLASGKGKHIPRNRQRKKRNSEQESPATRSVIYDVKQHHNQTPEIQDSFSKVDKDSSTMVEGHHIFPQAEYPKLKSFRENIIVLTPTQHKGHAHARGVVSRPYQYLCLQKKLDRIEKCHKDPNCIFYSLSTFKDMLCIAGVMTSKERQDAVSADDIRRIMANYYVSDKAS